MTLALELPEVEDGNSNADDRLRNEAARKALENLYGKIGAPRWMDDFMELCKGGWPWRVAAYIAWASTPKGSREPKTQDELARVHLGLTSDRAINTWRRKNPAIDEMVRVMQAGPLFKHRAEIFTALVAVAVKPEYKSHNDRKLALELMGDYMPAHKILAALTARGQAGVKTDAELDELAKALEAEVNNGNDQD
ncbi:MAG: hypothetical protein ACOYZ6_08025 [Chloroflexota bacterium]